MLILQRKDSHLTDLVQNVSGVAVVDGQGKLVASISASDIKGSLDTNLFADLYLPIGMYLEKCRPEFQRVRENLTMNHFRKKQYIPSRAPWQIL